MPTFRRMETRREKAMQSNVTALSQRRVERVKALAREVACSTAGGVEAFDKLRHSVAGELLNQGSIEVTQEAMAGLAGEEAQTVLKSAIQHANRVFYFEDRVLAAVVVPVAVRYLSTRNNAVQVWHGNVESSKVLSLVVKNATGAKEVAFDARFYRGSQLLSVRARELRDHLLAIESGEVQKKGLTKPALVRSGPESNWEVVYFLGVCVFEKGQEEALLDPKVEDKLRKQGCHAEWAMDQADPVAWSEGVEAKAQCLGYYSMHRGIQLGEDRLRTLQLDSLMSNMEQGVMGVLFQYAEDTAQDRVRLLISTNVEAAEFIWKRYGEEGDSAFQRALDEVISDRVADVRDIQRLDLDRYKALAAKKGIVW